MLTEPKVVERKEQPYAGIRRTVPMEQIGGFIQESMPKVFGHLGAQGVDPAGAPFLRFHVIDMAQAMDVEVGVPVSTPPPGDGPFTAGTLPAGRYATVTFIGPYDDGEGAIAANQSLQEWIAAQGLQYEATEGEDGDHFTSRFEVWQTDPDVEPDPQKAETEINYLLAEGS